MYRGLCRFLTIALLGCMVVTVCAQDARVWTDVDGHTILARFAGFDENRVILKGSKQVAIERDRLSAKDQEWLAAALSASLVKLPRGNQDLMQLPVRFYIVHDVGMKQRGVQLETWVTRDHITKELLPEINRIWDQAGIAWALESIVDISVGQEPGLANKIQTVVTASRDSDAAVNKARTRVIREICRLDERPQALYCIYLFPYVGQTYQGFASMNGTDVVVGMWTDKPSRGENPPQRALLVEPEPFKIGSLGRTCAHELGHNLGLDHPDPATQTEFHRVMGGEKHGYRFIPSEIKSARQQALIQAREILKWYKRLK